MNQAQNGFQNAALRQNAAFNQVRFDDQDRAQGVALTYVREFARQQKREEAWLKDLEGRSETDLRALRNLVLTHTAGQNVANSRELIAKWADRSPKDPEARFVRLYNDLYWQNSGYVPANRPDPAHVKQQYAWFAEHHPDMLDWLTSAYIQFLRNNDERPEARKLLISQIKTADANSLSQIVNLLNDVEDSDLIEDLLARLTQLQKNAATATLRTMIPNVLQQSLNASIARADWDKTLSTLDRLMAFSSPSATAASMRGTGITLSRNSRIYRNNSREQRGCRVSRSVDFAGPEPLLLAESGVSVDEVDWPA